MSDRKTGKARQQNLSMTAQERKVTRQIGKFYEQFHFPGRRPIDQDGLIFMRKFARSIEARMKENGIRRLRVLDAGCGTGNTSIALAHQFRDVDFTGIDNSGPSLAEGKQAARREGIQNLRFRKWNVMYPIPYKTPFDIILCLGVLHHTADMARVLANLSAALRADGDLYLWVYGQHGRYRHSLNVELLRMLLDVPPRPTDPVSLARAYAFTTDHGSPLDDLLGKVREDPVSRKTLEDPIWIADQFLNPHESLLSIRDLITLGGAAGLELDQLLGIKADVSTCFASAELCRRYKKLTRTEQLIALDLLLKPERYFVVMRRIRQEG
jgi:2-polyprenyl-3-methyl-5-hydroxy-6-metoxy-1,4-benzoquinol methylase